MTEPQPGLRRRLLRRAGARRARDVVCFMDCDGSLDPRELPRVADPVARGARRPRARRARRRSPARWPLHARVANARARAAELRRRTGVPLRDLGPMRAARREALLALGIADRRFGWPLEMVLRAAARGLADRRGRRRLPPARGPLEGHRHRARHRARRPRHGGGARVTPCAARDRQGAGARAREDAAVPAVHARGRPRGSPRAALAGHARRGARRRRRRRGACSCSTARPAPGCRPASRSSPQRGDGLAERLAAAFADVGGPALLVGMDTPQVTPALLERGLGALEHARRRARRRAATAATGRSACARRTRAVFARRADERARHRRGAARAAARARAAHGRAARRCATSTTSPTPAPSPPPRRGRASPPRSRRSSRGGGGMSARRHAARAGRAALRAAARLAPPRGGEPAEARDPDRRRPRRTRCRSPAGWRRVDAADRAVLAHAVAPVLDIGCGPGRHLAALAAPGTTGSASTSPPSPCGSRAPAAPTRSCAPSSPTCRAPGTWRTALLLDGNIGIGGAPGGAARPGARRSSRPAARCSSRSGRPGAPTRRDGCGWRTPARSARGSAGRRSARTASRRSRAPPGLRPRGALDVGGRWFARLERPR